MNKQNYEDKMNRGGENKGHPDAIDWIKDVVKNMPAPLLIQKLNKELWDRVELNHGKKERT